MVSTAEVDAARLAFLNIGRCAAPDTVVRRAVLASWERSVRYGVNPHRLNVRFVGYHGTAPVADACAEETFAQFLSRNAVAGCSLLLIDPSGVVRVRRDTDPAVGELLDVLHVVPGCGYAERDVGTTAASVALHEQVDCSIGGSEHFHTQLTCLAEAAALIVDERDGKFFGAVVVVSHITDRSRLHLVLARMVADQVAERVTGQPYHRARVATAAAGPTR
ncbi:hypothetical protein [Nocardia sp. NPDC004123]